MHPKRLRHLAALLAAAATSLAAQAQTPLPPNLHPLTRAAWTDGATILDAKIGVLGPDPFDSGIETVPLGATVGAIGHVDTERRLGTRIALREGGVVRAMQVDATLFDAIDLGRSYGNGLDVRVDFPLPEGGSLEIALSSFERRGARNWTWLGQIAGISNSYVILSQFEDCFAGVVANGNPGGRRFEVRPVAEGHFLVERRGPGGVCGGCLQAPASGVGGTAGAFGSAPNAGVPGTPAAQNRMGSSTADPSNRVDLLIVATDNTRSVYGSPAALVATAYAIEADINTRISTTGGLWSVRVVAAPWNLIAGYSGSGTLNTDLVNLRTQNDGLMDAVHTERDDFRPDLIALITEESAGGAGLAYRPLSTANQANLVTSGYSVTERDDVLVDGIFAHEIGHNMGLCHNTNAPGSPGNPAPGACPNPISSTSRGIERFCDVPDGICGGCEDREYRTTMAYRVNTSIQSVVLHRYSAEGLNASLNGSFGSCEVDMWAADAKAIIAMEVTRPSVSNYNVADVLVWTQAGTGGDQTGTWQEPIASIVTANQDVRGTPEEARIRARAGTYSETAANGGAPVVLDRPSRIVPDGGVVVIQ